MRILVRNTRPVMVAAGGHYFRPRSRTPLDVEPAAVASIEARYGLEVERLDPGAPAPAASRPAAEATAGPGGATNAMSRLPGPSDVAADANGLFPCPDCDAVAKSAIGLVSHRRAKHKEA